MARPAAAVGASTKQLGDPSAGSGTPSKQAKWIKAEKFKMPASFFHSLLRRGDVLIPSSEGFWRFQFVFVADKQRWRTNLMLCRGS